MPDKYIEEVLKIELAIFYFDKKIKRQKALCGQAGV